MACKLDIKASIANKVAELATTMPRNDVNRMFKAEVIKPNGRIFIPSTLVDAYYNEYTKGISRSPITGTLAEPNKVKLKEQVDMEINKLKSERRRLVEFKNTLSPINQKDEIRRLLIQIADISRQIDNVADKLDFIGEVDVEVGFRKDIERVDILINKAKNSTNLDDRLRYINEAQRIANFYFEAGNFEKGSNYLFDDIDLTKDAAVADVWRGFKSEMEQYQQAINEQYKDILVKAATTIPSVKDYLDKLGIDELSYEYLTASSEDKDWFSKMVLRPSKNFGGGNPAIAVQVLEEMIRRQEDAGIRARRNVITRLNELIDKIKGKHKAYDVFMRYDENGEFTGEILHPYSTKYFETKRKERSSKLAQIRELLRKPTLTPEAQARLAKLSAEVKQWNLENEIFIDYSYLNELASEFPEFAFETNAAEVLAYKNMLLKHLGQKGYESHLENIREKLHEYRIKRDYYIEMASLDIDNFKQELGIADDIVINTVEEATRVYDFLNSPFVAAKDFHTIGGVKLTLSSGEYSINEISELPLLNYLYTESIPRKYTGTVTNRDNQIVVLDKNSLTGYYDKNFDKITADNDLYEFWQYATRSLEMARDMMPLQYRRQYQQNSIMYIEKSVMEEFANKGMLSAAYSHAFDSMVSSLTDNELGTLAFEENPFDPTSRNINYNFLGTRNSLIDKLTEQKKEQYFIDNKIPLTLSEFETTEGKNLIIKKYGASRLVKIKNDLAKMQDKAKAEVAEKASFDLGAVLKFHLGTMVALNQRDTILPLLELMERSVKDIKQVKVNRASNRMRGINNELVETDLPVMNYIESVSHQMDVFTGQNTQRVEGVSKKKLYSLQEKAEKKRLEELKEKAVTENQKTEVQNMIDALGSAVTASGGVDTALAYLRVKGLGWNLPAQIPNAAAGYYANFGMAADGRIVKMSSMRRAYNLFLNITMPSFLRTSPKDEEVLKIKNLIERGDFLLDASSEMQKSRFGAETGKGVETVLSPYTLTRMTEYMNQGVLVMARLMSVKINNKNGESKPLWDAIDKNLNLKEEFKTEENKGWDWDGELMRKETTLIRKLIENTHGDYSETGRQMAKNYSAGRMAMFFKTWLPNVIHNRFGAYNPHDLTLGISTKGRYRSYTPGTAALAGATVGTWFAPGIGTAIGYALGMSAAKIWGNDINDSVMADVKDSFTSLGMLVKRLIYTKLSRINPKYADVLDTQFDDKFDELDAANLRSNLHEIQSMLTLLLVYFLAKAMLYDDDEPKKNQLVHNFIINQILKVQGDLAFFMSPQTPGKLVEQAFPFTSILDSSLAVIQSGTSLVYGIEYGPNQNTFGENFAKLLPSPLPRTTMTERVFNEPKFLKYWFEESK